MRSGLNIWFISTTGGCSDDVLKELVNEANELGINAIIGIRISTLNSSNSSHIKSNYVFYGPAVRVGNK